MHKFCVTPGSEHKHRSQHGRLQWSGIVGNLSCVSVTSFFSNIGRRLLDKACCGEWKNRSSRALCPRVSSFLLALWSPRLGKRELVCVLIVHLFVCFVHVSFCHFSLPLGVGFGCGLWLWHSLDFSINFFFTRAHGWEDNSQDRTEEMTLVTQSSASSTEDKKELRNSLSLWKKKRISKVYNENIYRKCHNQSTSRGSATIKVQLEVVPQSKYN